MTEKDNRIPTKRVEIFLFYPTLILYIMIEFLEFLKSVGLFFMETIFSSNSPMKCNLFLIQLITKICLGTEETNEKILGFL